MMRAIIAGGGTGGHVIPALAIARELRERYGAEVLFLGTARGIENKLVPAAGFELRRIEVGALKNVSAATRLRTFLALPAALVRSGRLLAAFRPQVVIGVGGYASGPGMLAAWMRRIPTLAFEPNLVPGFANRALARLVRAAAVHFPETQKYFRNPQVTGVPVRAEFFAIPAPRAARPPTLLVFGGSQGAHALNQALAEAIPQLRARVPEVLVIHQTGGRDYNEAQSVYRQSGIPTEVSAFIEDMPSAFARADLLICRAGASTVAEVCAAGKPALLVPFPRAADDHQLRNAQALERAGAALLLPESELSGARLAETAAELLRQPERLAEMGRRARALALPGAAAEIAGMAARLAKWSPQPQSQPAAV